MGSAVIASAFNGIINHLWQSTVFALAIAVLTLAFRKDGAQIRYGLWLSASLKFLIPFAPLIALGSAVWTALSSGKAAAEIATPSFAVAVDQLAQPFSSAMPFAAVEPALHLARINWIWIAVAGIWAIGFIFIVLMRLRAWLRIRAALKASEQIDIPSQSLIGRHSEGREAARRTPPRITMRTTPGLLEPGVVGIFRQTLLLPESILQNLTPAQLEAVLAHELAHIRRRDNLTAGLHMLVEAIFWFYPLAWWIGARLVEERERACDESVVTMGSEPRDYAVAILNVCKLYVESPRRCVSGVTGARLNKRIRAILTAHVGGNMHFIKKAALATLALAVVAAPLWLGVVTAHPLRAQSKAIATGVSAATASQNANVQSSATPFERRNVTASTPAPRQTNNAISDTQATSNQAPARQPVFISSLGTVTAVSVTVTPRVDGQLASFDFKEGQPVKQGQLLATISMPVQQAELERMQEQLQRDQAEFDRLTGGAMSPQDRNNWKATIQGDQDALRHVQSQVAVGQVMSPINGVAGFHLVDPGNFVHAGDRLVVINQLQPISVVFAVDQDYLAKVRPLLDRGANLPVDLLNRDDRTKIATGRLASIDNQIDTTRDTVRFRAEFDNKDGALFPNEFVDVHLFLTQ